jgi:hypothetical protein
MDDKAGKTGLMLGGILADDMGSSKTAQAVACTPENIARKTNGKNSLNEGF